MHNNKRRQNNMNGGGQHRHNNNNRPRRFNNNRPQGGGEGGGNDAASISRTRRNATQNREKYQMMARDALSSGDRVLNEYYLQHADHYHRVLLALPPEEIRPQQHPRHMNQQGGEHTGDQPLADQPQQDGAHHQPGNGHGAAEEHAQQQAHTHGLPSFITQPQSGGEFGE